MTPERWQRIEEVFHQALEMEPGRRAAFLDEVCKGDPDLRSEVESLVALNENAQDFLASPVSEAVGHLFAGGHTARLKNRPQPYSSNEANPKFDPLIGRNLGDFTIRERLGEGGFGAVYRAEQLTLGREAVVKVLRSRHRGNRQMIERFMREARLASRLEHPYTAHVYAFGAETDGLLWIAMEYVHGTPLDKLLEAQGPLPLERFVPLLDKICEVVETAHEYGIIHRDLKPANVMVISRAGRLLPKLLDFGIAKLVNVESSLGADGSDRVLAVTQPNRMPDTDPSPIRQTDGEVAEIEDLESETESRTMVMDTKPPLQAQTVGAIGSPFYMAPEQWRQAALVDARTDIYALGVLAYESITGHPPFHGSSQSELARAHASQPVSQLDASFPSALNGVLAKALAKRPEERYRTATEFAQAFREAAYSFEAGKDSEASFYKGQARYPGLSPFTEADAEFFFGREKETELFINRIRVQPLLALVGPSGAGKSSFLQAGVIASLPDNWSAITIRPGPAPFITLEARLAREGIEIRNLQFAIRNQPDALGEVLREAAEKTGSTIVLVIDQFEELFTLCADEKERLLFSEALSRAARSVEEPVRVILTLRDDFLIRAEQLVGFRNRLSQGLQLLTTPGREELLRILTEPARRAGYEFEDQGLPKEIVDEVAGQSGALPLLAFTAAKLWEKRDRQFRQLRRKPYKEMGGVGGALAQHAEAVMAEMTLQERRLVREAFRHLVTGEGTRAVLTRPELTQVLGGSSHAEAVVERLVGARLLVASEAEGGVERIEIVHEALLTAWPRLVRWRQEDAEGARLRDQLRTAARQWEERGRTKGLLWRDEALREYQLWHSRYPGRLTEVEEAFGKASLAEVARGRRAKRFLLGAIFIALALGSLVFFWQRQQIKRQLLESYEEQGRQELLNGSALRALVYLSEVYREKDSPPLRFMIAQAMRPIDAQQLSIEGHTAYLNSASFSPDGMRIVTASADRTAKVWDAATGKILLTIEGHTGEIYFASFSPDSARIVTAGDDKTAKIWDAATGKLLTSMEGHKGSLYTALFSPDGTRIVTASLDKTAKVWETATGKMLTSIEGHADNVLSASFSPDGTRIVTAANDKTAKIWDAATGKMILSLEGHTASLNFASFSPDGTRIVTAGDDKTAKIWDAATGKAIASFEVGTNRVMSAAFSPDGRRIVTAGFDKTAKIWDAASNKLLFTLEGHTGYIFFAAFSPDGERVVTASFDKTARVWDASKSRLLLSIEGHKSGVASAAFSPDGMRIVTAGDDKTAKIWDAATGKMLISIEASIKNPPSYKPSVAFGPDGKTIITVSDERTATVWDAATGKLLTSIEGQGAHMNRATYSPDGTRIVTAGDDKRAVIWDAATGKPLVSIDGHIDSVRSVAFSSDGKRVVTASMDSTAKVWDCASGKMIVSMEGHTGDVISAAFSPDGKRIVTAGQDGTAKVWDSSTGRLLNSVEAHMNNVEFATFSPDGNLIVTVSIDKTIKVWDASSGKLLISIDGHIVSVHSVAFSPDGKRIVTASDDRTAKVWDVHLETRSPAEIAEIVKRRVPFRLEQGRLIPTY